MEDGETIKVKHGRNPEIQAEAAGTELLRLLGFPTDEVVIAQTVRCYGCPRYPFLTLRILSIPGATRILGEEGRLERSGSARRGVFVWRADWQP